MTAPLNTPWTKAFDVETWNKEWRSRSKAVARARSTTVDSESPVCSDSSASARQTLSDTSAFRRGATERGYRFRYLRL